MEIEKEMVELFINSIKLLKDCESLKQLVNEKEFFEPYAVFTRIDRFQKSSIDLEDILNFLKDTNHFILRKDYKEIELFIEHYDRNSDGNLNFEEFLDFILNKTNPKLRATSTQRKTFRISLNEFLPQNFEALIAKLILAEMKSFNFLDKKKLEIHMTKFDLLEFFVLLDRDGDGFISAEDISGYLRIEHDIVLYSQEISFMISLYDEDLDNLLNWNEYLSMIMPSKSSYEFDKVMLRDFENKYVNMFYESLRREKLKKNRVREDAIVCDKREEIYFNVKYDGTRFFENKIIDDFSIDNLQKGRDEKIQGDPYEKYLSKESEKISNTSNSNKFYSSNYESLSGINIFVNEIYSLLKIDLKIEEIKSDLARNKSFYLIEVFKFFDRKDLESIRFVDFIETLGNLNVIHLDNSNQINKAELLFKKFDKQNEMKLK